MKDIILFDTSVGTLNHGDEIIMESVLKNTRDILEGNFVAKFPTHTPCFTFYQQTKRNPRYRFVRNAHYKFICGTNIINNKMYIPWTFWNISLFDCKCYNNSVLLGVGVSAFPKDDDTVSWYSKKLFSSFLSKTYKHSVRDERTRKIVDSILGEGSAINTGCPTMWGLTKEHCSQIPVKKAKNVVFTLTDYAKNSEEDQYLIDTLLENYENVYFWPQGTKDYVYFNTLSNIEKIKVISPNVSDYSEALKMPDMDYVGTRLHAGIFAMQHKVRSVIIAVDNRAEDMNKTYNINVISRGERTLADIINSEFATAVNINEENIKKWKSQFLK